MNSHVPASGTVYTPAQIASAMVSSLGDEPEALWLDPCVGLGAFPTALAARGVPRERITAFDIEPQSAQADKYAQVHRSKDFIEWSEQACLQFDRVILNPPYVALSRIHGAPREAALRIVGLNGIPLSLKANYWSVFLLASLRVLRPGGSLCAILPASWDFAMYARHLREEVPRRFASTFVLRSRSPLFGDVQDGSVVLVARNYRETSAIGRMNRIEVATREQLVASLNELPAPSHPSNRMGAFATGEKAKSVPLSRVMDLRLGGVTGDAGYFLLSESQRIELELPLTSVQAVVTRARHLQSAVLDKRVWERLRQRNERVWLFRPPNGLLKHPKVLSYLSLEQSKGGCHRERWKVQSRDPWHRTPLPSPIHGFMSGMSRHGPCIVLKNMERLSATNTLYVVRFRVARSVEERASWCLSFLTSDVRTQINSRGRLYADGLLKFEPNDLSSIELPIPHSSRGANEALRRATKRWLAGDQVEASGIADLFIMKPSTPPKHEAILAQPMTASTSLRLISR